MEITEHGRTTVMANARARKQRKQVENNVNRVKTTDSGRLQGILWENEHAILLSNPIPMNMQPTGQGTPVSNKTSVNAKMCTPYKGAIITIPKLG